MFGRRKTELPEKVTPFSNSSVYNSSNATMDQAQFDKMIDALERINRTLNEGFKTLNKTVARKS